MRDLKKEFEEGYKSLVGLISTKNNSKLDRETTLNLCNQVLETLITIEESELNIDLAPSDVFNAIFIAKQLERKVTSTGINTSKKQTFIRLKENIEILQEMGLDKKNTSSLSK